MFTNQRIKICCTALLIIAMLCLAISAHAAHLTIYECQADALHSLLLSEQDGELSVRYFVDDNPIKTVPVTSAFADEMGIYVPIDGLLYQFLPDRVVGETVSLCVAKTLPNEVIEPLATGFLPFVGAKVGEN